jgi:tetratricopeptide (TPR) repeat protein
VDPVTPEHPADRAVRLRDHSAVPADDHAALDAILTAFDCYEAGDDSAAREHLAAVGLGSPFLEWRLLARGLMAYSAGDDARAVETFTRLDPNRLPARLAAPVRATIDSTFRQTASDAIRRQADELTTDRLTTGLRQLRSEFGRGRSLRGAFRKLDQLLPLVKTQAPQLVPRLAACFYRAIITQGEESDLARFRRAFGPPPDDPEFHRLQAIVFEESHHPDASLRHWSAYERWLATGHGSWSAATARRARAIVLHHLGCLAAEQADDPDRKLRDLLLSGLATNRRRPAPASENPVTFWRRALDLAPDWDEPAQALFRRHVEASQFEEAEAVARRLLEHDPTARSVMVDLANLHLNNGRLLDCLELRKKILADHPLDRESRVLTALTYLLAARQKLIECGPAGAQALVDEGGPLCRDELPGMYLAFRSVLAEALDRPDEAMALLAEANSLEGRKPVVALVRAVDATLAKLRPAVRKAADQALADVLAGVVPPRQVTGMLSAWAQYEIQKVNYRGRKTQEKKLHDLVLRTLQTSAPEIEFEDLVHTCSMHQDWKLVVRLAGPLRERYPTNPVFPLHLAEAQLSEEGGATWRRRTLDLLRTARRLAEQSSEPRHRDVLDAVRELEDRLPMADEIPFADLLFGR